jgi:hypothetical protein
LTFLGRPESGEISALDCQQPPKSRGTTLLHPALFYLDVCVAPDVPHGLFHDLAQVGR